jgi:uncharacterized protein YjbJ (UPF0337 family)
MNSDKFNRTIDDAAGRVRRQLGEWTGDFEAQVGGAVHPVRGMAEKVVGRLRDAVHNAKDEFERNRQRTVDVRDRETRVTDHRKWRVQGGRANALPPERQRGVQDQTPAPARIGQGFEIVTSNVICAEIFLLSQVQSSKGI